MTNLEYEKNELSEKSMGGTELMMERLYSSLNKELLDKFQIIPSRVRELNPNKVRILYLHDLPEDPESQHLKDEGWRKFNKLVFVSNWQMQKYIDYYNIPWEKCIVMQNAIKPIPNHEKPRDEIRLGYWSTPHRGLEILVPVFLNLVQKYPNLKLDVFSSFKLYGWPERDKAYEKLFEICKEHPNIDYHGSVDNKTLREKLRKIHIMAYPSIWAETSCLCLMEAMSAKCLAVHSNLGALHETSANWTYMYQFHEDPNKHAGLFHNILEQAISNYWDNELQARIESTKTYTDIFYNWSYREKQWEGLLTALQNEPTAIEEKKSVFHYRVG